MSTAIVHTFMNRGCGPSTGGRCDARFHADGQLLFTFNLWRISKLEMLHMIWKNLKCTSIKRNLLTTAPAWNPRHACALRAAAAKRDGAARRDPRRSAPPKRCSGGRAVDRTVRRCARRSVGVASILEEPSRRFVIEVVEDLLGESEASKRGRVVG